LHKNDKKFDGGGGTKINKKSHGGGGTKLKKRSDGGGGIKMKKYHMVGLAQKKISDCRGLTKMKK
jgi:hypothetical protein